MNTTNQTNWLLAERPYRSFIISVAIATAVIFGLLTIYVHKYQSQFMPLEFLNWTYQQEFLDDSPAEHNDFIVIGDSRARAGFIPLHNREITSRNLSLGGGTPIEAYLTLKRYLKRHSTNAVVISIAPYHISSTDVFWERSVKSGFINFANVNDLRREATTANDDAKVFESAPFPTIKYAYFQTPIVYRAELRTALTYPERTAGNSAIYKQLAADRGYAALKRNTVSGGLSKETRLESFEHSALLTSYLIKTIRLAQEHDLPVYWYTAPVSTLSCAAIKESYRDGFIGLQLKLIADTGMVQLNERSCLAPEMFVEPNHVNPDGARIMTETLINRLLQHQPDLTS